LNRTLSHEDSEEINKGANLGRFTIMKTGFSVGLARVKAKTLSGSSQKPG
jgi:hypothetical protein